MGDGRKTRTALLPEPEPPATALHCADGRTVDLSTMPQMVIEALIRTVTGASELDSVAAATPVDEPGALDSVQAAMQVASWAGGVAAQAAGTLLRASWLADEREARDLPVRLPWVKSATHASVVDEVALVTGQSRPAAARMIALGYDRTLRSVTLREHLRAGLLPLDQATRIFAETKHLPEQLADEIAARVLAPRHLDANPPGASEIRVRLTRQLQLHDPNATRADTEEAMRHRDVATQLHRDGTATLSFRGDPAVVTAAADRVRRIAAALRAAGSPRTKNQLRADLAAALICRGQLPTTVTDEPVTGPECTTCSAARSGTLSGTLTTYPAAHVTLVMTFATLVGADEATGEIPGHGFVPAHVARDLALSDGATWRRLLVDDVTGAAHTLDGTRYQPTSAMRAYVTARDHDCRGPDCTIPAHDADLDHDIPWPAGTTSVGNLSAKHRRCHQHKTSRQWTAERDVYDDTITWTTRAGRLYLTAPHDYTADEHRPVDTTDWVLTPPDPRDPPPF